MVVLIVTTVTSADARWRHRHHRHYDFGGPATDARAGDNDARAMTWDEPRRSRRGDRGDRGAELMPRDWTLEDPKPEWHGKRFLSPDRQAWFAIYSAPVDQQHVSDHMKTVAFVDGETITYLQGESSWIAVSGLKGDRIFYRKAVIACGGRTWHHVAYEYPMQLRRTMDRFVSNAAAAIQRGEDQACDQGAASATR